ncbi:MAG: hypothetical protein BBJ60_06345 [Desulfobacterales bacterium S7086C20]|nr:MAG: hypothetical protein BBJ60_06345 [Desulfobacterales bacterium S7086C20]
MAQTTTSMHFPRGKFLCNWSEWKHLGGVLEAPADTGKNILIKDENTGAIPLFIKLPPSLHYSYATNAVRGTDLTCLCCLISMYCEEHRFLEDKAIIMPRCLANTGIYSVFSCQLSVTSFQ